MGLIHTDDLKAVTALPEASEKKLKAAAETGDVLMPDDFDAIE